MEQRALDYSPSANSTDSSDSFVLTFSLSPSTGNGEVQKHQIDSYTSFPSPRSGKSPSIPTFRVPQYGYFAIEDEIKGGRENKVNSSVFHACMQSTNFFVGVGVLALPYALRMTGWFGLLLLALFGTVMAYTAMLFGNNRHTFPLENFSDHIEVAFSTLGRILASFIFYSVLFANTTLFVRLFTDVTGTLFQCSHVVALLAAGTFYLIASHTCTRKAPIIMRLMSILGTISTILLLIQLITALLLIVFNSHHRTSQRSTAQSKICDTDEAMSTFKLSAEYTVYWTDAKSCIQALGIYGYCYMGHEVFPSIMGNMRHPSRYSIVVTLSFAAMVCIYALIASLGYAVLGRHTDSSIVDSLPSSHYLTIAIKLCVLITTVAKLGLTTAPLTDGLMEWFLVAVHLFHRTKTHVTDNHATLSDPTSRGLLPRGIKLKRKYQRLDEAVSDSDGLITESTTYNSCATTAPPTTTSIHTSNCQTTNRSKQRTQVDFRNPLSRQKYFQLSNKEEETEKFLSTILNTEFARRSPTQRSTHALSWSEAISIPVLHSPSCENLSLIDSFTNIQCAITPAGHITNRVLSEKCRDNSSSDEESTIPATTLHRIDASQAVSHSRHVNLNDLEQFQSLHHLPNTISYNNTFTTTTPSGAPKVTHLPSIAAMKDVHCPDSAPDLVMRTFVPLLALWVSTLFHSYLGILVLVGGFGAGSISIVIPCLCYYRIHHSELSACARCAVWTAFSLGVLLIIATITTYL